MILLTGATGFVGGHLLDALVDTFGSENIVALTSKPITKCRFLLHNGYSYVDDFFIKTDFADIDTIIHAGAFIPKSGAESNDILNCNSNILSTTRLITSTLHKIQKFIFLSTIDVYGCANTITEDTVTEPISLYGYSKLYCEKLITIWATQKSLNHQILRIGHVYGPGEEKYKKIIPLTMQRLLSGEPIQVYGEGNEIRSFIFISDVVKAILESLKLERYVGAINIVGQEQIRVRALIDKLISISKIGPKIEKVQSSAKPRDFIFDNSKMRQILFKPETSLADGLQEEWNYTKRLHS